MAAAASLTAVASVPKAVVDQCFRPGALIGNTPGSFSVGDHVFLGLRGFAFELKSLAPRPPYHSTDSLVGRSTVTDFFEGTA